MREGPYCGQACDCRGDDTRDSSAAYDCVHIEQDEECALFFQEMRTGTLTAGMRRTNRADSIL